MGKGLNTKSGRMLQMIRHGENPNVFDPTGLRVVTSNFDHTYAEQFEFENRRRAGINAGYFNARTDGMAEGQLKGPLFYNLMDDEVLPYLLSKCRPQDDITAAGVRSRIYYWALYDRSDKAFFAVEEGRPGSALRGGFGMFTSFKWTSKTGKKSTAEAEIGFVTQTPEEITEMTGVAPQNTKIKVVGTNVSGPLGISVAKSGGVGETVAIPFPSTVAQIRALVEATTAVDAALVTGAGVTLGTGEVHTLTANNATVNATPYVGATVAPGMAALTVRTALRALGGVFANVDVTGSTTGGRTVVTQGGTPSGGDGGQLPLTNLFDGNPSTLYGSAAVGPNNVTYTQPTGVTKVANSYSLTSPASPGNSGQQALKSWRLEAFDGSSWIVLDTVTNAPLANSETRTRTLSNTQTHSAHRLAIVDTIGGVSGNPANLAEFVIYNDSPGSGAYNIAFPSNVGNVPDISATPGVGWTGASVQPGAGSADFVLEITAPATTKFNVFKASGDTGYVVTPIQIGGNGITAAVVDPKPVLSGHVSLWRAENLAGLDLPAAKVGTCNEVTLDVPKLAEPHHFHDGEDPTKPVTYHAHKEPEDLDAMVTVILPTDEDGSGHCSALQNGARQYVSKAGFWRIKMVCPETGYEQRIEFYGSIGKNTPLEYNENVEERHLVFNLLENRETGWCLRWQSNVPA